MLKPYLCATPISCQFVYPDASRPGINLAGIAAKQLLQGF
jgi:hypothetical protein